MSKLIVILKAFGLVLAFLIIAWVACIYGTALLVEWAGDMKRKYVHNTPIK